MKALESPGEGGARCRGPQRAAEVLLALLALFSSAYFYEIEGHSNANAHFDQCYMAVAHGELSIDPFVPKPGIPGWTCDFSRPPGGRHYPNKPPGLTLFGTLAYAPIHLVEKWLGVPPLTFKTYAVNRVLVTVAVNGGLAACGFVLLLRYLRLLGFSLGLSAGTALALGAGTGFLPFASMFYSHTPAAVMVLAAVYHCAAGVRQNPPRLRDAALSGAFAGLAVLIDFITAPAVLGVLLFWLARGRSVRGLLACAAGGLPFAALLLAYNAACFGSPLSTSYSFTNSDFVDPATRTIFGLPPLIRFRQMLLEPHRGLLVYSPVLILALPGLWRAFRTRTAGSESALGLFIFAGCFTINLFFRMWDGGWTTLPRYVIPGILVLAPAIAFGIAALPRTACFLAGVSVLTNLGAMATDLLVRDDVAAPIFQDIYPALLGMHAIPRSNLGMLALGAPGALATLLPFAFWWIAGVWWIDRLIRREGP